MHSMKVAAIGRYGRLEEEARRVRLDSGCIYADYIRRGWLGIN